ncbi:MAG: phosphoadenylyl-sulfate reductase [Acidimicrobiales bacterium]
MDTYEGTAVIEAGRFSEEQLAAESSRLESLTIEEAAKGALNWVIENFGSDYAVASSFQDVVLVELAVKADPAAEVIFLDTEFHFPETLAFVERLRKIWGLNLTTTHPAVGRDESPCGSPNCCQVRKVAPLNAALAGKQAWVTGLKRVDTPERAEAPILAWDAQRGMVKVNPMAGWTDDDVAAYLAEHELPLHPLTYVGYVSIGCAPTTQPVADGQNPREGRWPGSDKTECGLHI